MLAIDWLLSFSIELLFDETMHTTATENINNKVYQSLAWRGISICNFYEAKYDQAEEDILKAVKLQEQIGDTSGLANSYKILTGIYWETERYDKSIEIFFHRRIRDEKMFDSTEKLINTINKDINKAVEILQKGGIILYPTDTIWGLGCDATNQDAVQKIY